MNRILSPPRAPDSSWALLAVALASTLALLLFLLWRRPSTSDKRLVSDVASRAGASSSSSETSSPADAASVPLVMLVNVKSGGGLGVAVMALLARMEHASERNTSAESPPDYYPLSREGIAEATRRLAQLRSSGQQPRLITAGTHAPLGRRLLT
jgi:hypothetical protein